MKFKLTTSGHFYTAEEAEPLEKLGFVFKKTDDGRHASKAYNCPEVEIEINTLDELIQFIKEWRCIAMYDGSIEIYDDYRE